MSEKKGQKRHYDVLGPNEYGRFLLIREPESVVIDSGTESLSLRELQRDIEGRLRKHGRS